MFFLCEGGGGGGEKGKYSACTAVNVLVYLCGVRNHVLIGKYLELSKEGRDDRFIVDDHEVGVGFAKSGSCFFEVIVGDDGK